jgi:hypothetical protein
LEKLYGLGFAVQLKILAVEKEFSTIGIHERYESQKEKDGFGRWTAQESHDASYVNMPRTIETLEKTPFLSSVSVLDRDNSVLYENSRVPGGDWKHPVGGASRAIRMFRDAPLSDERKAFIVKSCEDLIRRKTNRNAPADEIETIRDIQKSLLGPKEEESGSFRPRMG